MTWKKGEGFPGMIGKKQSLKWRKTILKSISKPCSEEKKKKLRLALKGRHCSPKSEFIKDSIPWNKGKKFPQVTGKRNSNWKGGITPKNKLARHSIEYKTWRTKVFERNDYTCQGCDERGTYLHAHHLISFAKHPKYRHELWNGQTVCKDCHDNLHEQLGR